MEKINPRSKFDDSDLLDLKLDLNLLAPVEDLNGARRDQVVKPPSLEVSIEIYLQPWIGRKEKEDNYY